MLELLRGLFSGIVLRLPFVDVRTKLRLVNPKLWNIIKDWDMSALVELDFESCDADGWGEDFYPKKTARGWRLTNLEGLRVNRLELSAVPRDEFQHVTLRLSNIETETTTKLYGDCKLTDESGKVADVNLDRIQPIELAPVLDLLGQEISLAEVLITGTLVLKFSKGHELKALVHPQFESWEVAEQVSLYSQPGKGPVIATLMDNHMKAIIRTSNTESESDGGDVAAAADCGQ